MTPTETTEYHQKRSEARKQSECIDPVHTKAWELYPFDPFYMRGYDYAPNDLNEGKRIAFVAGYHTALLQILTGIK